MQYFHHQSFSLQFSQIPAWIKAIRCLMFTSLNWAVTSCSSSTLTLWTQNLPYWNYRLFVYKWNTGVRNPLRCHIQRIKQKQDKRADWPWSEILANYQTPKIMINIRKYKKKKGKKSKVKTFYNISSRSTSDFHHQETIPVSTQLCILMDMQSFTTLMPATSSIPLPH